MGELLDLRRLRQRSRELIESGGTRIRLTAIVAKQPRPGWVTIDVPPLEEWEEPRRWLSREQAQRVQSAAFYRMLQDRITRRFLELTRAPAA